MAIKTIKKAKSTKTCAKCGSNVAGSASKCQNCGSTDLSKKLVLVRKSEATGDDASLSDADLETASEVVESEESDDDIEDIEEEDFEPADEDDDESDEDDTDEDDDEDDGEEDDEEFDEESDDDEEEEDPKVTKRVVRRRAVSKSVSADDYLADIALAALAMVTDVSKSLGDEEMYEDSMNNLNHAMDAVFEAASAGNSISKEDKAAKLARLKARLATLKAKLGGGGDDSDDDEDDVEKSDDLYAGLNAKQAAVIRMSQELIEKNTNEKFETIAKSYGALPTPSEELGKALRFLSENDNDAYITVTKALGAAAEAVNQSDIFKSFGSGQPGAETTNQTLEAIAKSYQEKDSNLTPEQATYKAMQDNPRLYDQALRG